MQELQNIVLGCYLLKVRAKRDRENVPDDLAQGTLPPLAAMIIVIGLAAGLSGMLLGLLLHLIQHIAFGYSLGGSVGTESFLDGVEKAATLRRVLVVSGCGLVAGLGWAEVSRFGKPLVSISQAVSLGHPRMPILSTTVHALLQIVTVALGSPLGREVAPREMGALFAEFLSSRVGLSASETRVMVACGVGAGLAAVYNVPVATTIFILKVLLRTARRSVVVLAFACCLVAAFFARIGLGNESQYAEANYHSSVALVVWATAFGPLFGMAGHSFKRTMSHAQFKAPRGVRLIVASFLSFLLVALLTVHFPELLGNGKGLAQLTFSQNIDLRLAAELLILKVTIIAVVFRGGARWSADSGPCHGRSARDRHRQRVEPGSTRDSHRSSGHRGSVGILGGIDGDADNGSRPGNGIHEPAIEFVSAFGTRRGRSNGNQNSNSDVRHRGQNPRRVWRTLEKST